MTGLGPSTRSTAPLEGAGRCPERLPRSALGLLCFGALACGSDSKPIDPEPEPTAVVDAGGAPVTGDAATPPVAAAAPQICGPGGWCWDNPEGIQSNSLLALDATSLDDVWVVGESGVALHHDGESWKARWAPTSATLRGVYVGASEVWAVGDQATVLRFDGEQWHEVAIEGLGSDVALRAVTGRGEDVWIVGDDGTLLERQGGSFESPVVEGGVDRTLHAAWASATDVWVVGEEGRVARHDGSGWTRVTSNTARHLYAVHGAGDSVFVAGQAGAVRRWNAEELRLDGIPNGSALRPRSDIHGLFADGEERFYASSAGDVFFWDGEATCPIEGDAGAPPEPCPGWGGSRPTGQQAVVHGLWVAGEQALAVGEDGAIVRFDGPARTVESRATLDNFLAVAGAGSSVWVAGDRLVERRDGRWQDVPRDSERALYAVQPLGVGVMVAGTGGVVRQYADSVWQSLDVRPDVWLRGLWREGQTGWLVGSRGSAWALLNGTAWTELETPTNRDLLDVWTTESGIAWAVGEQGVILRHDGRLWADIPSGPEGGVDADLRAVWGAENDLWAVGTGGAVLHWDGSRWQSMGEPAGYSLNERGRRTPDPVWAVGTGGTILHFDGQAWQSEASGTSRALNAVWGDGERLWIAGERGTVLVKTLD